MLGDVIHHNHFGLRQNACASANAIESTVVRTSKPQPPMTSSRLSQNRLDAPFCICTFVGFQVSLTSEDTLCKTSLVMTLCHGSRRSRLGWRPCYSLVALPKACHLRRGVRGASAAELMQRCVLCRLYHVFHAMRCSDSWRHATKATGATHPSRT